MKVSVFFNVAPTFKQNKRKSVHHVIGSGLREMPAWQSILWIFQVFFTRWCGIMASKKSFLRMMIIVPSAVASAASASSRGRRRLKGPSASSGMWSSTTTILLLYLLVLEVAAFQQNFGKIGKSELLLPLSLGWQSWRGTINQQRATCWPCRL